MSRESASDSVNSCLPSLKRWAALGRHLKSELHAWCLHLAAVCRAGSSRSSPFSYQGQRVPGGSAGIPPQTRAVQPNNGSVSLLRGPGLVCRRSFCSVAQFRRMFSCSGREGTALLGLCSHHIQDIHLHIPRGPRFFPIGIMVLHRGPAVAAISASPELCHSNL